MTAAADPLIPSMLWRISSRADGVKEEEKREGVEEEKGVVEETEGVVLVLVVAVVPMAAVVAAVVGVDFRRNSIWFLPSRFLKPGSVDKRV
jgi:hypothetical protein